MVRTVVLSRVRRVVLVVVCLTTGIVTLGAVEARAAPLSLAGETFTATSGSVTGTCTDPLTSSGSFTFSVSGTATGPYPGTFTESGDFAITNFEPTGFSSTFTITSVNGTVTGSKAIFFNGLGGGGGCGGGSVNAFPPVTYTALINRHWRDTGTGNVALNGVVGTAAGFTEDFVTSNGVHHVREAPPGAGPPHFADP